MFLLVEGALFFIPSPPTSLFGIGLIADGAALWLIEYFAGECQGRVTAKAHNEEA